MHDPGDVISTGAVQNISAFAGVRQRHDRHHVWVDTATPLASNYHNSRIRDEDLHEQWLEQYEGLYFLWPATLGVFVPSLQFTGS